MVLVHFDTAELSSSFTRSLWLHSLSLTRERVTGGTGAH